MAVGPEVLLGDLVGDIPISVRPLDFDLWVATAGPDLLRFAMALTGNAHDAADAVRTPRPSAAPGTVGRR
jgi:hypothetical protein